MRTLLACVVALIAASAGASGEEVSLDSGVRLRLPAGYKRTSEASEESLGTWERSLPAAKSTVPDHLKAVVVPLDGEIDVRGEWVRGRAFCWGSSELTPLDAFPGGRTLTGYRIIDGVPQDHVAAFLPLEKSALVLLVRGEGGRIGALLGDVDWISRQVHKEAGGPRIFRVEQLDVSFSIPGEFVESAEVASGLLGHWERPGMRSENLSVAIATPPKLEDIKQEWKDGHDFTWGADATDSFDATWTWPDPRGRYFEGIRLIDGVEEFRLAALFPVEDKALVVYLSGKAQEGSRLRAAMQEIALSLGAVRQERRPLLCGGCIQMGPPEVRKGFATRYAPVVIGATFILVLFTWLAFRKRPRLNEAARNGENARFHSMH